MGDISEINGGGLEKLSPMVLIPRDDWGAVPPTSPAPELDFPLLHTVITYLGDVEESDSEAVCKKVMQVLQKKHMDEGFSDIGFNFVIGGDGQVYEGRGWNGQPESTKFPELNGKRLDIAYMGLQSRDDLRWVMYKPALQLLSQAVDDKKLDEEYNNTEDPPTEIPDNINDD